MPMWKLKTFEELDAYVLYKLLQVRSEVFVVEQTCVYQDIDGLDTKAIHLYFEENGVIKAYARLFKPNDYYTNFTSIGRVLVAKSFRKQGLAHQLIKKAITYLQKNHPDFPIKIGAQLYLKTFYESHGFVQVGNSYIEDGIPHIYMISGF